MAATRKALGDLARNKAVFFISWRRIVVISLLFIVAVLAILLAYRSRGSDTERGNRALIEAFREERLIEPRLSGGFRWSEFNPLPENKSNLRASDLARAQDLITDGLAKGEPNSALAYARLLLSENNKLPEASKHLRRVLTGAPNNADAQNDLAVCLIQEGRLEDALDSLDAALNSKPEMKEALFNQALCHERLLLRQQAGDEYTGLLNAERERGWVDEIRRRQERMRSPLAAQSKEAEIVDSLHSALQRQAFDDAKNIVGLNFEVTVRHALFDAPIEYLREAVAGNTGKADQAVDELKWMGAQTESFGDRSIADIGDYVINLPATERPVELNLINEYRQADGVLFRAKKYSEAQAVFERLSKQFAQRGNSIFHAYSDIYAADCQYASSQFSRSIDLLRKVTDFVSTKQWPYVRTYLLLHLAGGYSRLDQDSMAIRNCEQVKDSGRNLPLLRAKASQYLGNAYWRLGNLEKALTELRESTNLYLATVPTSYELAYNYLQMADIYRLSGNHPLATLFADQSLGFSDAAKDYGRAAQASSFLAVESARLKLIDKSQEQLSEAFEEIEKIDPSRRGYTEALVLSRAGEVAAERSDINLAEQYYSRAESLIGEGEEGTIPLLRVLRGRAEAHSK